MTTPGTVFGIKLRTGWMLRYVNVLSTRGRDAESRHLLRLHHSHIAPDFLELATGCSAHRLSDKVASHAPAWPRNRF